MGIRDERAGGYAGRGRRALLMGCAAAFPLAMLLAGTARADAAPAADTEVGEVVVTALKRSELLSRVGASVTAISSEQLKSTRVEAVSELAGYTPNVDIKSNSPGANVVVTIRGVGIDDFSTTVSPAAGVYVDEVPLSSLALMGLSLFDLERVEVLRGPQGTLYGRNSIAGAVNILSARPGKTFGGYVEAGYGNYDRFDLTAAVDLPVNEDLSFRLSGKTVQQGEGYWRSNLLADGTPGSRRIGKQNDTALRLQAAYSPTSYLRFNLKLEGERSRSESGPLTFYGSFKVGSPFTLCDPVRAARLDNTQCTDAFGYRNLNKDPEYRGDWIGNFPLRLRQYGAALHTTVDFSDMQLDLITGAIDLRKSYFIDGDGTPRYQLKYMKDERIRQFTQEARLSGETERFQWLVGGFYSWDRISGHTDNLITQWPLVLLGISEKSSATDFRQVSESAAAFASTTWHVTPQLDLEGGLRYTHETRDFQGGTTYSNPVPAAGIANAFLDDSISNNEMSWKLAVNYRPSEGRLFYGSVSTATKGGGFFSNFAQNTLQLLPYRPANVTAYEVGTKLRLSPSFTVNAAVFHYDMEDVQAFILYVDPVSGLAVQKVGNIEKARVTGADFDAVFKPVEGLTLQGSAGFLDTRLGSFATTAGKVAAGNRLPDAPKATANALVRYERPLGDTGLEVAAQVDARYISAVYKEALNNPLIKAEANTIVNARISLGSEASGWELSAWGKNLFDRYYLVSGGDVKSLGIIFRGFNAPRTFGVTLNYKF